MFDSSAFLTVLAIRRRIFSDILIKLLEAIGALSVPERMTAEKTHFQENVTLPTNRWHDNDAIVQEDPSEDENTFEAGLSSGASILAAIGKVSISGFVVCHFLIFL